jgi:hypothetical protein
MPSFLPEAGYSFGGLVKNVAVKDLARLNLCCVGEGGVAGRSCSRWIFVSSNRLEGLRNGCVSIFDTIIRLLS